MRLWHKDLVHFLPRQQILGQWRECCAIIKNISKNGTPNHILVNKIMEYEPCHLYTYAMFVNYEMVNREYNCDFKKFREPFVSTFGESKAFCVGMDCLFYNWMNDRYLIQCFYNLQEKYDCGGISNNEWQRIENYIESRGLKKDE